MRNKITVLLAVLTLFSGPVLFGQQVIDFDFEDGPEGWKIPDWAFAQEDCVGRVSEVSSDYAKTGNMSLKIIADFPGDKWASAVVERDKDIDLGECKSITAYVYLPEEARSNLFQARILLTVGPSWWFIESREAVVLKHGEWTKVSVPFDVNRSGELTEWKCKTKEQCLIEQFGKVNKIAVRIEYNANPSQGGPRYDGPIYVDDIVIDTVTGDQAS